MGEVYLSDMERILRIQDSDDFSTQTLFDLFDSVVIGGNRHNGCHNIPTSLGIDKIIIDYAVANNVISGVTSLISSPRNLIKFNRLQLMQPFLCLQINRIWVLGKKLVGGIL